MSVPDTRPHLGAATLDQAELDRLLDQRAWAHDMEAALARYEAASAQLRARLPHHADLAYGNDADERLDWYPPAAGCSAAAAPVVIFVHGGAWRSGTKESNSFAADTAVQAGAHFVPIEFTPCPRITLAMMADQVCRAIAWVHGHAADFGADGKRIVLVGHSSGSHLLALAAAGRETRYGVPSHAIRGAICSSGFYDLEPVARSARNEYLRLTPDEARALSPIHYAERIACPVLVTTGEHDNALMQEQADAFAGALVRSGIPVSRATGAGLDHFEVAETYGQPGGLLADALCRVIELARHPE